MTDARVLDRLAGLEEVARGIAQAMSQIDQKQEVLTNLVAALVQVLTPEKKPKDGLPLKELLAALVGRLDKQNDLLTDVAETVTRAVVEIPAEVARAVAGAMYGDGKTRGS